MKHNRVGYVIIGMAIVLSSISCSRGQLPTTEETTANVISGKELKEVLKDTLGEAVVENIDDSKTISIADFKKMHTSSRGESLELNVQTPIYNIYPTQPFTVHFKTKEKLDPIKAVTVHLSADCNPESQIDTLNYGYVLSDGVDIVISPSSVIGGAKLASIDRLGNNSPNNEGIWGYANTYYLAINYDTESDKTIELSKKIVIPFTVRQDVATPFARANVNADGKLIIEWTPVEDAESYRIYYDSTSLDRVKSSPDTSSFDSDRYGYIGVSPIYVKSANSNSTSCAVDVITEDEDIALGDYYVTAVKEDKESNFSNPISAWRFSSLIPIRLEKDLQELMKTLDYLPSEVNVVMADESLVAKPVDYTFLKRDSGRSCYSYQIEGTSFSGEVWIEESEGQVKNKIDNGELSLSVDRGMLLMTPLAFDSSFCRAEYGYFTDTVGCYIKDGYNPNSLIRLDKDSYYSLLDVSNRAIENYGILSSEDLSLKSGINYLNDALFPLEVSNRETLNVDLSYGDLVTEGRLPQNLDEPLEVETKGGLETEAELPDVIEEESSSESAADTFDDTDGASTPESEERDADEEINVVIDVTPDARLIPSNLFEADLGSFEIEIPKYPFMADSMEEAYLAVCLQNGMHEIPLNEFVVLMNNKNLITALLKVIHTNPYINPVTKVAYSRGEDGVLNIVVDYLYSEDEWNSRRAIIRLAEKLFGDDVFTAYMFMNQNNSIIF